MGLGAVEGDGKVPGETAAIPEATCGHKQTTKLK